MVARTGSHYHPYRLEEQRDKVVLPEPRDQAHPVEARTMVGLPYRGWRYSEDIATVREVTRGRKTGCGKGEITLVSPLHSTFILTPVPPHRLNPEGKVLLWKVRIQTPQPAINPTMMQSKEQEMDLKTKPGLVPRTGSRTLQKGISFGGFCYRWRTLPNFQLQILSH